MFWIRQNFHESRRIPVSSLFASSSLVKRSVSGFHSSRRPRWIAMRPICPTVQVQGPISASVITAVPFWIAKLFIA
jgi:hypothetical protein